MINGCILMVVSLFATGSRLSWICKGMIWEVRGVEVVGSSYKNNDTWTRRHYHAALVYFMTI